MTVFDTVLIANRGEIACRIIATLRTLGVRSVAVYSDADAAARHVSLADVAVRIGRASAADSYLNVERIVGAAVESGAQAIHPGYGFLAENAQFAAACAAAGIVFIGPNIDALEIMGDKIRAKAQVTARGVPVVPGVARPGLTDSELMKAALEIGFPALIKPSAGGGGKGMHVVWAPEELEDALAAARREAKSSFGDDTLFIERFLARPRHIEVQVLADGHGNVVHLGERECSLQRRHQKVIEEAPSPLIDETTRERIGEAACESARSVGYLGAGTVEFIVSADAPDEFFFIEMNTRLQVEHPVTELVTGIDLVEWQLRIAAGEPLDFAQRDVELTGHAVEARVYAEDPTRGFLPTGGTVLELQEPTGAGIRVDSALVPGLVVSSDYDPMLAKVIAWAPDRASALQRLRAALRDTVVLGVGTNVEFLGLLLSAPAVESGDLDTELIGRILPDMAFAEPGPDVFATAALIRHADGSRASEAGPWATPNGWRMGAAAPSVYRMRSVPGEVSATVRVWGSPSHLQVRVDDGDLREGSVVLRGCQARVTIGEVSATWVFAESGGDELHLSSQGVSWTLLETRGARGESHDGDADPELRSPLPGAVVAISVTDGQVVEAGAPIAIVEAMKMEHVLRAPVAGSVSLRVALGSQVAGDQIVATIVPVEEARVLPEERP
ncbi:MAG TPA: biotin carboxylase N-terminal domain-containing protein [Rhodoglobus sp.]|nr:biotin carboxylase N-terminal domain-containing protein [Rhodoglobus sp.]